MKISLTIDNGPDRDQTPAVLDVLAAHDVKATFFVLGCHITTDWGRDLLQREHDAGHRIGNHTYSHREPLGILAHASEGIEEIEKTQKALGAFADRERLFRPFGEGGRLGPHLLSRTAYEHLRAERYSCILWNSVPRDWEDPTGWVDTALAQASELDWAVTVIHDIVEESARQLDRFLTEARRRGGEFVTEFPDDCVPLLCGTPQWDMSDFLTER